jgi:hypothetical protein
VSTGPGVDVSISPEALPADWPWRTNVTLINSAAAAGTAEPRSSASEVSAIARVLHVPIPRRRAASDPDALFIEGFLLLVGWTPHGELCGNCGQAVIPVTETRVQVGGGVRRKRPTVAM